MKLYFVRHGKAAQNTSPDEQRPLTADGIESVKHMASLLKKIACQPIAIYTSPRVRALQTATLIADALGMQAEVNEACNFSFNAQMVMTICDGLDDDDEVMFVGHNPSMSEVVQHITGATVELSTGAIACVTDYYPPSSKNAILKWLLTPKVIDPLFSEA
jgi:phosphohistidine phosphatase